MGVADRKWRRDKSDRENVSPVRHGGKSRATLVLPAMLTAVLLAGCAGASTPGTQTASAERGTSSTTGGTLSATGTSTAADTDGQSGSVITGTEEVASDGEASAEELRLASHHVGDLEIRDPEEEMETMSEDEEAEMDRAIRAFEPADSSLLINDAEKFYYYEALNEDRQKIYDAMLMAASNPEASVDEYAVPVTVSEDPRGSEFVSDFWTAYYAMVYDHPEFFWLYNQSEVSLNGSYISNGDGSWKVYIFLEEPYENYEEEMTAFNNSAQEFLADIDTSGTQLEVARDVHDKLRDLVTYDTEVSEKSAQAMGKINSYHNLAHTAYGSLVADSEGKDHYAVCDGYSLAYEYLLQQLGIEAVVIPGEAGENEENAGGHAWNMVNLDGRWYEVDCTWDDDDGAYAQNADNEAIDYRIREAFNDSGYMEQVSHAYFGVTTLRMRKFSPDEEQYFTASDGTKFSLVSESVHIRDSEFMAGKPTGEVAASAPTAE